MSGDEIVRWDGDGPPPAALSPMLKQGAAAVARRYPVAASRYWLELCAGPDGAAFRSQALPDRRELAPPPPGDSDDPFGELSGSSPLPGVVRRFRDRVLVFVTGACAMRCRHCTRKNLVSAHSAPAWRDYGEIARYVRERPEIREILLSGGDPLTLGDRALARRIGVFTAIDRIYSVRIGTRVPCVWPGRVTPALAKALGKSKKVWVNTQFNHPAEVSPEAARACGLLVDAGVPVSCQSVLLKGVNDNPDTLEALFRALQAIRVRPYYAFAGDPVSGTAHFRVTAAEAAALEAEVALRIGGMALPRFVVDRPGAGRKEPVAVAATAR